MRPSHDLPHAEGRPLQAGEASAQQRAREERDHHDRDRLEDHLARETSRQFSQNSAGVRPKRLDRHHNASALLTWYVSGSSRGTAKPRQWLQSASSAAGGAKAAPVEREHRPMRLGGSSGATSASLAASAHTSTAANGGPLPSGLASDTASGSHAFARVARRKTAESDGAIAGGDLLVSTEGTQ